MSNDFAGMIFVGYLLAAAIGFAVLYFVVRLAVTHAILAAAKVSAGRLAGSPPA